MQTTFETSNRHSYLKNRSQIARCHETILGTSFRTSTFFHKERPENSLKRQPKKMVINFYRRFQIARLVSFPVYGFRFSYWGIRSKSLSSLRTGSPLGYWDTDCSGIWRTSDAHYVLAEHLSRVRLMKLHAIPLVRPLSRNDVSPRLATFHCLQLILNETNTRCLE